MLTNHDIHFNADTHTYTVNGEVKRSVTQILKDNGIVNYDGLDTYYADRGTAVHDYCTLYAQGWLDWDTVREDCIGHVRTFERLVWELGLEYVSAEQLCYDEEFDYCGQYDLIMMRGGKRTLVELKTGEAPMWLGLQLAAYERMVKVDDVIGISLKVGKVYEKADDFVRNHIAWREINDGSFDLDKWKGDKKRRRMKVMK